LGFYFVVVVRFGLKHLEPLKGVMPAGNDLEGAGMLTINQAQEMCSDMEGCKVKNYELCYKPFANQSYELGYKPFATALLSQQGVHV
jgi:hypothetical protein